MYPPPLPFLIHRCSFGHNGDYVWVGQPSSGGHLCVLHRDRGTVCQLFGLFFLHPLKSVQELSCWCALPRLVVGVARVVKGVAILVVGVV